MVQHLFSNVGFRQSLVLVLFVAVFSSAEGRVLRREPRKTTTTTTATRGETRRRADNYGGSGNGYGYGNSGKGYGSSGSSHAGQSYGTTNAYTGSSGSGYSGITTSYGGTGSYGGGSGTYGSGPQYTGSTYGGNAYTGNSNGGNSYGGTVSSAQGASTGTSVFGYSSGISSSTLDSTTNNYQEPNYQASFYDSEEQQKQNFFNDGNGKPSILFLVGAVAAAFVSCFGMGKIRQIQNRSSYLKARESAQILLEESALGYVAAAAPTTRAVKNVPVSGEYKISYLEQGRTFYSKTHLKFGMSRDRGGWEISGYGKDADGHFKIVEGFVSPAPAGAAAASSGEAATAASTVAAETSTKALAMNAYWVEQAENEERLVLNTGTFHFDPLSTPHFEGGWKASNGMSGQYHGFRLEQQDKIQPAGDLLSHIPKRKGDDVSIIADVEQCGKSDDDGPLKPADYQLIKDRKDNGRPRGVQLVF